MTLKSDSTFQTNEGDGNRVLPAQDAVPESPAFFISYAQNHEDVMLYRALRDVKRGFYIDVGAQDPLIDSVTKTFYDLGWHGINIEPSEEYFQKLEKERPHDVNLATALGREAGEVVFYQVDHTGLSTTNAAYAERHSEAGFQVERREVPCTTLDRICADCNVNTVHFLKIDVEGSERAVLEGFSLEAVRPWLVVVEATEPNSQQQVFSEWEELLIDRRYRFVYFDGLNRFYAAEEHADLARHFSRPPNFFDQYVSYQLWRTRADLDDLQAAERTALVNSMNHLLAEVRSIGAEARSLSTQAQNLRESLAERERWVGSLQEGVAQRDHQIVNLQQALDTRERQLAGVQLEYAAARRRLRHMRSSLSWKLTGPLREVRRAGIRFVRLFRRPEPPSEAATSTFASSDLALPDEVAAALTEPARLHYHNLRDATAFERSTGKSNESGEKRI